MSKYTSNLQLVSKVICPHAGLASLLAQFSSHTIPNVPENSRGDRIVPERRRFLLSFEST